MIPYNEIFTKTYGYFFKRKCSSATQQEVSPPPKSVDNSILDAPGEKLFRTVLRLLIWDQPYLSAVAFVTLNIFYWLIVAWSRRFISIVSIFGIFIFLHRTYTFYYWPPDSTEPFLDKETKKSWLGVRYPCSNTRPSIIANEMIEKAMTLFKDVCKLRKDNRGLFCSLMCGFFSFLAFVGKVFPGVLIIYGFVLIFTLGPGVLLHLIPRTIFEQASGFFNESDSQASPATTGPSDRDSDLEEFVPELSPETLRQLSLKEDTPEAQSMGSSEAPDESIPPFEDESYVNESDDFSLYQGLGSFPSVEEENESDLDDSDKIVVVPTEKTTEMHFDPKHFKEDSSSASEDSFTEGLSFDKKTAAAPSDVKVEGGEKPRSLSLSDEDELADFEILEESDIPT